MLRIRLARRGRKGVPCYRVVVMESARKRDGRFVADLGFYSPTLPGEHPDRVRLDVEGAAGWVRKGAKPTDPVRGLLCKAGLVIEGGRGRLNPIKGRPRAKALQRMGEAAPSA